MRSTSRLWRWLGLIFVLSFGALGYLGWQIYLTAPPIPKSVVTTDGEVLFTGEQIQLGQQAWMSAGGQQLGTVWGHGSYVAPDWSADWLHREATALQAIRSAEQSKATRDLDARRPGCHRRPGSGRDAPQHLRRVDRNREGLGRACEGDPRGRQPLRRPVRHRARRSPSCATVRDDRRRVCPRRQNARLSPPSFSGPRGPP